MDQLIKKAKNIDWVHWVDRPYSPFMITMNMTHAYAEDYKRVGLKESEWGYETSLYQYPVFYYQKELEQKNNHALEKYFQTKTIFDISQSLIEIHEKNKEEIKKIVGSEMPAKQKLSAVRELARLYSPFLWLNISLEKHYQNRISNEVPKHIKTDNDAAIKDFISKVSIPKKKNAYSQMLEMLESGIPTETVHKKFAWMKSRDGFTDFYTLAELEEIKKNHKRDSEDEKMPAVPAGLKDLVSELQELTYLRTNRTDSMYEMFGLIRPIFQEVAKSLDIPFRELEQYDIQSILNDDEPRKIRTPFNCLYIDNTQVIQYEPIISVNIDKKSDIKGISAYLGIVKGRVKIVRHPSELEKVKNGDILVSQMTLPSFISAMQKATAFVTDEGGITCHAAIVAREMKKPCITGTKIATRVLKDNDLVEVNADNGTVKVLS